MILKQQNISIQSKEGYKIPGIFIEGNKGRSAVLMAHGLQGSKNEYLDTLARISEKLQERDIASLRIDFCGHGDSKMSLDDFSLSSQIDDLSASLEWLINEKNFSSIIILGISFGAPPAIITSELYKKYIKKCILIAPVLDYKNDFLYPKTLWGKANFGYNRIISSINGNGLKLDNEYILGRSVLMNMLLVDVPSFTYNTSFFISVFHGKCDNMISYNNSSTLASKRKNVNLVLLENTEHGITEVDDETFEKEITIQNLEIVVNEIIN